MKISLTPGFTPTEKQAKLLLLLEDNRDFDQLVWMVRGKYGIHPADLVIADRPTGVARGIWETLFEEKQYPMSLRRIRATMAFMAKHDEFSADRVAFENSYKEYLGQLHDEWKQFQHQFRLPRNWADSFTDFLVSGQLEAISDDVVKAELDTVTGEVIIRLSASMTKSAAKNWLEENWTIKMEPLLNATNLPSYKASRFENLNLYKQAYQLRWADEFEPMKYIDIAAKLNKTSEHAITEYDAVDYVKAYQKHLDSLLMG